MKRTEIILVAALAIPLAGCVLSGKPKPQPAPAPPQPVAPAPPPQPLSSPQTQAEIYPQTPPAGAFNTVQAVEVAPAPAPETKNSASKPNKPPPPAGPRTPPDVNAAPPPTLEPPRAQIQEIVPTDELKDLKEKALDLITKVDLILANTDRRGRLSSDQRRVKANVEGFVKQYAQAEKNNDIRAAFENAQKAFTLAQGLPGAK